MSAVLAVIPARFDSTRFPGKPLARIAGKPMIQHVYERTACASGIDETVVATDDPRIADAVRNFKGHVEMTSVEARSGTERVAEVARNRNAQVVINVQGDEPLIEPEMLAPLAEFLKAHKAVPMASLMTKLKTEDAGNPNVVKVVTDQDGFALYFSRAPIPFERAGPPARRPAGPGWKHLGIYGYQRRFVMQFPSLKPTPLEQLEQLEQLRALENGYKIKLLETPIDTLGVDTPEDLAKVERVMAQSIAKGKA